MSKPLRDLHPEVFTELDRAWKKLDKRFLRGPKKNDIQALLGIEAKVFELGNNGRHDAELESFMHLETPEKQMQAQIWFENRKNILLIAIRNGERTPSINKQLSEENESLKIRIHACETAIGILGHENSTS